jgi:hypothetical protein
MEGFHYLLEWYMARALVLPPTVGTVEVASIRDRDAAYDRKRAFPDQAYQHSEEIGGFLTEGLARS